MCHTQIHRQTYALFGLLSEPKILAKLSIKKSFFSRVLYNFEEKVITTASIIFRLPILSLKLGLEEGELVQVHR